MVFGDLGRKSYEILVGEIEAKVVYLNSGGLHGLPRLGPFA
jgi:hypothetical protein